MSVEANEIVQEEIEVPIEEQRPKEQVPVEVQHKQKFEKVRTKASSSSQPNVKDYE